MMAALYRILLSPEEQQQLKDIVHQTKVAKHKRMHAQILLCLDKNGPKLTEAQTSQCCIRSLYGGCAGYLYPAP